MIVNVIADFADVWELGRGIYALRNGIVGGKDGALDAGIIDGYRGAHCGS
jgi:hypothetical protein